MPRNRESMGWVDRNGRTWLSCDACWAAVAEDLCFVAKVDSERSYEAGACYCRPCALSLIEEWRTQLIEAPADRAEARP